jgi:hypothetical protein
MMAVISFMAFPLAIEEQWGGLRIDWTARFYRSFVELSVLAPALISVQEGIDGIPLILDDPGQMPQSFRLQLSNAFPREMHGVCNGLKGLWIMLMQTEAANHDLSLSVVQLLQPAVDRQQDLGVLEMFGDGKKVSRGAIAHSQVWVVFQGGVQPAEPVMASCR